MNWGDIKTAFQNITGENPANSSYFPESRILAWANQSLRDLARETNYLEKRDILHVVAGTQEYDLPTNVDEIFRVTYDWERIRPITQIKLRAYNQRWRERSGKPRMYYLDQINQKIGLYERPDVTTSYQTLVDDTGTPLTAGSDGVYGFIIDSANAPSGRDATILIDRSSVQPIFGFDGALLNEIVGDGLEIFYSAIPEEITTNVQDIPEIPRWASPAILYGILIEAYSAETPLQDFDTVAAYSVLYRHIKNRLKVRSFARLPRAWAIRCAHEKPSWNMVPRLPQHIPPPSEGP